MAGVVLALLAGSARGANKYWTGPGGTTNSPTSGMWQTGSPTVWSDGTASTANAAWMGGDTAIFGGVDGAYGINVGSAISAAAVKFYVSGCTISAPSAQTIAASGIPFISVAAGKSNIIGTNVTVAVALSTSLGAEAGGGPGGVVIIENGGTIQQTTNKITTITGAGAIVSVRTGGTLKHTTTTSGTQYIAVGSAVGDDATLSVDGGTVSIARNTSSYWIPAANAATGDVKGTLTLNAGLVSSTGGFVELGTIAGNTGTLNLNGGTLFVDKVIAGAGTSIVNFNGGTFKALNPNSAFLAGLTMARIRDGGAVIDSNGNDVSIGQPLGHSTISGDNPTDGGLLKIGAGTLTLTATNTYTGATTVSAGTLALSGSISGPVVVSAGGTLAAGGGIGMITISNSLTLSGAIYLRLDRTSTPTNDVVQGLSSVSYGGQLVVGLVGGTVSVGDVFTLFRANSFSGEFEQIILPTLPYGFGFDTTHLAVDGTLRVIQTSGLPVLNGAPTSSGLLLSWSTLPSYQYQLITSTNLLQNRSFWTNYGPPVLGDGTLLSQIAPTANSARQFFSLKAFPLPIDPARLPAQPWKNTQWADPGGWTTIDVSTRGLPPNNTNIDASLQLSNIIASTSGRRRLYFPAGIYSLRTSYFIHNNDIWIDGAGSNTVLSIDAPGSDNMQMGFSGSRLGSPVSVAGPIVAGDAAITLTNASTFAVGDMIQLYADNAPLTNGGLAFTSEIYSQNLKIMSISGDTLNVDMKILLDYPASYTPLVQRYRAIQNVKMSRLKIVRVNQPTLEATYNYAFFYAWNCTVVQVESSFSGRDHFKFQDSKDCVIESNYVHDCWVHNTGGYGYGFTLVSSTGCRLSNNKTTNLRHHYVLSGCLNVVSYNSVEVCYDYNDVAFHASYAYMNLVEGNMFTESYADTSKDGWPDVEPTTGPENTWFRNYASGEVGSIQSGTKRQNVIGNDVGTLVTLGSDHYMGANLVAGINQQYPSSWPGGTTNWGVFSNNVVLPASLYLTRKPTFLGSAPWPAFGPGVAGWGVTNVIPARIGNPMGP
jgi:autotransporter-associated beta strand protein